MQYSVLSFIPYIIFTAVQLFACKQDKQKLRKITKVALMPCLALAYYLCGGSKLFVFLGIALGWAGDIILIRANEYIFRVLGATSFAAGHFFFLYTLSKTFREEDAGLWMLVTLAVCVATAAFIFSKIRSKIDKSMQLSCLAYLLLLGIMTGVGFCKAVLDIMQGASTGIFTFIGYVFFLMSDSMLINQWFTVKDPWPSTDFKVMLTYTLAQLFICLGFL